jgi:hypothetical protein
MGIKIDGEEHATANSKFEVSHAVSNAVSLGKTHQ